MKTSQRPQSIRKLRITRIEHLATQLDTTPKKLIKISENPEKYYVDFKRNVKGKSRDLVRVNNPLAEIQGKILHRIISRLTPTKVSYGSVKGRGAYQNALVHAKSPYILKLDIKSFYLSIRYKKVFKFFSDMGCSPEVSRIMTFLSTRRHSLPLGTSTSPMLADQILHPLDRRISGMAKKAGLKYTRYVDDITISGNFPVEKFVNVISDIIWQQGLNVKRSKLEIYAPGDGKERIITGVALKNGKTTAPQNYIETLRQELLEAHQQSLLQEVEGKFGTQTQYRGRINYVMWLDKKEGQKLLKIYCKVKWKHLENAL